MSTPDETSGMSRSHRVYLSLGSNVGERRAQLRLGLEALEEIMTLDQVSSVFDTAPMLVIEQPRFYNIAVSGLTALEPLPLLSALKAIERLAGRTEGPRYGPRPLDIDILLYDDLVLSRPELTIPHPGIPARAFVLEPLSEIAPHLRHPALGASIAALLKTMGSADVQRLGPL